MSERVAAIWDQRADADRQQILARIPMGRLGELHELAAAVAFLLGDSAGYITGHTIDVSGGLFMG
jgi:3-oxoacyl-[acyl-carrier protein] reductase